MGVVDEHWCSRCKKSLDKKKDEYLETNGINDPGVLKALSCHDGKGKKEKAVRFSQGLLCRRCAMAVKVEIPRRSRTGVRRKISLWVFLKALRKKGNPNFTPVVLCSSFEKCGTYSAARGPLWKPASGRKTKKTAAPCRHCSVDPRGRLYCKRRHPGTFSIPMEKAVLNEQKRIDMMTVSQKMLTLASSLGRTPQSRLLESFFSHVGMDPQSAVVPDPTLTGADMKLKGPFSLTDEVRKELIKNVRPLSRGSEKTGETIRK